MLFHLSDTKIAPHPQKNLPGIDLPEVDFGGIPQAMRYQILGTNHKSVRIFPFLSQLFWAHRHPERRCLLHLKLVRFGTDESGSKVYVSCGTPRAGYRGAVIAEGSAAPPLCQLLFGQQPSMFPSA